MSKINNEGFLLAKFFRKKGFGVRWNRQMWVSKEKINKRLHKKLNLIVND